MPYRFPGPLCPECHGGDTRAELPEHWPGDASTFACADCGHIFPGIVPEPSDGYEGDGVFAANH